MNIQAAIIRENGIRRAAFIDADTGDEVCPQFEIDKACLAFENATTRIVTSQAPIGYPGCKRFHLRLAYDYAKLPKLQEIVGLANRVATSLGLAFLASADLGPHYNVTFEVL
ncbi:MAG: hypothetical protein V1755_06500 [Chloroflexota bacterium]